MKLEKDEFRRHVQSMIDSGNKKQLEMWIEHGLLICVNHEQLTDIWDEEFEEVYNSM